MITQDLTPIADYPKLGDVHSVFRQKADVAWNGLYTFSQQLPAWTAQANALAEQANADATTANNAAASATGSANFKGTWSSATTYTMSDSVEKDGVIYIALLSDNIDKDPATQIAYWAKAYAYNKAQVGLENVDNTADVDKPVSVLQRAYTEQLSVLQRAYTEQYCIGGVGQSWQAVSELNNTSYTNTTGKPFVLAVYGSIVNAAYSGGTIRITVNNENVQSMTMFTDEMWLCASAIVPHGAQYAHEMYSELGDVGVRYVHHLKG